MNRLGDLQTFLVWDYSQIEIRMLAEISGDKLLIQQFQSGEDIHCLVGQELTGWPVEKIAHDDKTRTSVKEFHFGMVYGHGVEGMHGHMRTKGIKITRARVQQYQDRYFHRYKAVGPYIQRMRKQAAEHGYVDTLFGPFRRDIRQNDESRGTYWGNQAINSPIQGSAHQLILMAMALLHLKPRTYSFLQKPVMEVHDELYFFVPLKDLQAAYKQAKYLLEVDVPLYALHQFKRKLQVPLVAEAKAGFCLGSLVDYEEEPTDVFLTMWRKKQREIENKPLKATLIPEHKFI